MLSERPELERFLLSCLVNKLGDPDKKVGSGSRTCLASSRAPGDEGRRAR